MKALAAALVALLLVGMSPALGSGGEPDCGGPGDAGGSREEARRLAPAEFQCLGRGTPGDEDWYVVAFEEGDAIRLRFPAAWADLIVLDVYSPSGILVRSSATQPLTDVPIDEHGDRHLRVAHSAALAGSTYTYTLSFWAREATGNGTTLVDLTHSLPGRGLAPLTGPGGLFDGVDGQWVALPGTTHGGESLVLPDSGDHVSYYDEDLQEIDGPHVQHFGCHHGCRVPAGAAWMILSAMDGYEYVYRY